MTEQERKQRIQEIRRSARETDEMAAESFAALQLTLTRLEQWILRQKAAR